MRTRFLTPMAPTAQRKGLRSAVATFLVGALAFTGIAVLPSIATAAEGDVTVEATIFYPDGSPVINSMGQVFLHEIVGSTGFADQDLTIAAGVVADADGTWSATVAPGNYIAEFIPNLNAPVDNLASGALALSEGAPTAFASTQEALTFGDPLVIDLEGSSSFDFTFSYGGILSGTVFDENEAPVANQPVTLFRDADGAGEAFDFAPISLITATTDSNGDWSQDSISPSTFATFAVGFGGENGYSTEFYNNANSLDAATPLTIGAASELSDVNASLVAPEPDPEPDPEPVAETGSISGRVTAPGGTGLTGATVSAYRIDLESFYIDFENVLVATSTSGNYTIDEVPPGEYLLYFEGPNSGSKRYLSELYGDARYIDEAELVTVEENEDVTGINAGLALSPTISGTISLAGATVNAEDLSVTACLYEVEWDWADCGYGIASISPSGAYVIGDLDPGKFSVQVTYSGAGNFRDEIFPNARYVEDATFFSVSGTTAFTGKNVQLDPGATISGHVSGEGDLVGAEVSASFAGDEDYWFPGDESAVRGAVTDANGNYTIGGLWPDTYSVFAEDYTIETEDDEPDVTLAGEWSVDSYSVRDAELYTLGATTALTSVDFQLATAGSLSGTIVDSITGDPVPNAFVEVSRFVSGDNNRTDSLDYIETDEDGTFTFTGLPMGDYLIDAATDDGSYLSSYFGAEPGEGVKHATRIFVDGSVSGLTVPLVHSGTYTGKVVNAANEPLEFVAVGTNGDEDSGTYTDENGEYELTGLNAGQYDLTFSTWEMETETSFVGRTISAPEVQLGTEPTLVETVVLDQASVLKGAVTNASGAPVVDAYLTAVKLNDDGSTEVFDEAEVNAKGEFAFRNLPVGKFYVRVDSGKFPTQFAGGSSEITVATPFVVSTPGEVLTRDIKLYAGATVSGILTDKKTGAPLKGMGVAAVKIGLDGNLDFRTYTEATSNSTGAYVLPGLSAGSYLVLYNSTYFGSIEKYSVLDETIAVSDKQAVKRNKSFTTLAKITGTVRDGNGVALDEANVEAINTDGEAVNYAYTSSNGGYYLYLEPGSYTLLFSDDENRGKKTYLGGSDQLDEATFFTVASTAIANKNATLLTGPASVTAHFVGEFGDELEANVTLYRRENGDVVWSQEYYSWYGLDGLFPITNLELGDYLYDVVAYDDEGYYELLDQEFTIAEAGLTDIGAIELGEAQPFGDEDEAVLSGDAPAVITDGSPEIGETVAAFAGEWTLDGEALPSDQFSFQWLRNGKIIPNATGTTYVVQPGDAGKTLSFYVRPFTDFWIEFDDEFGFGPSGTKSAPSETVALGAAAETVTAPVITGSRQVGQKLTVSSGEWSLTGATVSFRWEREVNGGAPKVVSTTSTYTPVAADLAAGVELYAVVSVKKPGFETRVVDLAVGAITPAVALVQTAKSTVTKVGAQLTISKGTWSPAATSYSYLWTAHDNDGSTHVIESCTTNVCTPELDDQGDYIDVVITGKRAGYTAKSVRYIAQLGRQLEFESAPVMTGVNKVGRVLGVDTSGVTIDPAGPTTFTYQWKRNGVTIAGATKSTFTPTAVGGTISVAVTAKRTGYVASLPHILETDGTTLALGGSIDATLEIAGNPWVGRTVSMRATSPWSPIPDSKSYQWYRYSAGATDDRVAITGATAASYVIKPADVTTGPLTLVVTLKKAGYTTTKYTLTTGVVAEHEVTNVTAPSIASSAKVGTVLTAKPGTWDVAPTSYLYQWFVNGRAVYGANAATYTPNVDDVDEQVSVSVIAKRTGIPMSAEVSSNVVTVERGAAPTATTAPVVKVGGILVTSTTRGKTLSTSAGAWSKAGLEFSFQWQIYSGSAWDNLDGQTAKTLKTDSGFATGKYRVVVTAAGAGVETSAPKASNTVTLK